MKDNKMDSWDVDLYDKDDLVVEHIDEGIRHLNVLTTQNVMLIVIGIIHIVLMVFVTVSVAGICDSMRSEHLKEESSKEQFVGREEFDALCEQVTQLFVVLSKGSHEVEKAGAGE